MDLATISLLTDRQTVSAIQMLNPKIKDLPTRDDSQAGRNPVEYQTENGFSIIRLADVDSSVPLTGTRHYFVVRDPHGYELDIKVELLDDAVIEAVKASRGRLTLESSFWTNCAERHLVMYLAENEDYPPDGRLTVGQLTIDDLDLARRWNCDEEKK